MVNRLALCRVRGGFLSVRAPLFAFVAIGLLMTVTRDDSAKASFPGNNGLIAFRRELFEAGQLSAEIYVTDPDGGEPINITNNPAADYAPAWSPDGTRIAFARNTDIFIMNADGSNAVQLTNDHLTDFAPTWSPDGSKIAFGSLYRQPGTGIYVMNCDGGDLRLVAQFPLFGFDGPDWSPDGTQIAFGLDELYVINADGTGLVKLTDNGSATDLAPSWSPDGSQIAFISSRDKGIGDVYVMDADGSNQRNLTKSSAGEDGVSWSPDGSKLAFISLRDGNQEVYVMDNDGDNVTRLTDHPAADLQPSWQPVGGEPLPACVPAASPSPAQSQSGLPATGGPPAGGATYAVWAALLALSLPLLAAGAAVYLRRNRS